MADLGLDEALLLLNGWLGQRVRVLIWIPLRPSTEAPPSGPEPGWHLVAGGEGELRKPDVSESGPGSEDQQRQFNIGTYEVGEGPLKLLLDDLPCKRVSAEQEEGQPPHRLVFYLPGSMVILVLERPQPVRESSF